jgi:hypothetical protein
MGIRDSDGNALELEPRPIGGDGQGTVYKVRLSDCAVKLMDDDRAADPEEHVGESLVARLSRVRWLPLEDLPVFMPLMALAAPHVGYVMRFQAGMVPIAGLREPPEDELRPWYFEGGGLRRRLRLLARCAGVLATLHGRGLVYGDVAPGNVLVSAVVSKDEVWLINPDNITTESSVSQRPTGTRLYRAPEIVRRESGATQFSDAYSFAILAYETLRADHPLIGDATADLARQHDAESGVLPWTGHATDERNRSSYGIPARWVLTSRLTKLFGQAFEDGLHRPLSRPRMLAWLAALGAASDRTVSCPNRDCRHTYYAFADRCPFCEAPPPDTIMVGIHDFIPGAVGVRDGEPVVSETVDWIVLQDSEPFVVTSRHSRLVASADEKQVLRLRWRLDGSLELSNVGDSPVRWMPSGGSAGRTLRPGASTKGRADGGWLVHFGDDQRIHRVLTFGRPGEPAAQANSVPPLTARRGA